MDNGHNMGLHKFSAGFLQISSACYDSTRKILVGGSLSRDPVESNYTSHPVYTEIIA
jgi:hypothetical protein